MQVVGRFYDSSWKPMKYHRSGLQKMDIKYRKYLNLSCTNIIQNNMIGDFTIQVKLLGNDPKVLNSKILYWSAKEPLYGEIINLPYPNSQIAYDQTPWKGVVQAVDGLFEIKINYPASYYENGYEYKSPHLHFQICASGEVWTIELGEPEFSLRTWYKWILLILGIILVILAIYWLYKGANLQWKKIKWTLGGKTKRPYYFRVPLPTPTPAV